eukprot:COSAG02_NODE_59307_length_274_cov_1.445714_1_plen_41_part_10
MEIKVVRVVPNQAAGERAYSGTSFLQTLTHLSLMGFCHNLC